MMRPMLHIMKARLATRTLAVALLTWGMVLARICLAEGARLPEQVPLAEDAPAASFISATPDLQCDEFNRSWKVLNQHSYLSIKVTIRWHAVGAKEMQEEFILPPRQGRAIGCAPSVEVVSAEIMQF